MKMEKKQKLLSILFDDVEKVCIGSAKESFNVKSPFQTSGEYYTINPLSAVDHDFKKKDYYAYNKPRRADINVESFRNFIFEIDSIPLSDQLTILKECGIVFTGLVYSGGKSVHALLSLEKCLGGTHTLNGVREYKRVWERIAGLIDKTAMELGFGKVVDPSCKNPSRFTRYPEFKVEGRNKQDVLECEGKRLGEEEFNSLLLRCPELACREVSEARKVLSGGEEISSMVEFWKVASVGLKNSIKYPMWARDSAGLYPEALKIVLWAIDETGVEKELLLRVFEKTVFRQYAKVGYPQEKWTVAIDDAYNLKF